VQFECHVSAKPGTAPPLKYEALTGISLASQHFELRGTKPDANVGRQEPAPRPFVR